jgi:hypothetical protein
MSVAYSQNQADAVNWQLVAVEMLIITRFVILLGICHCVTKLLKLLLSEVIKKTNLH